MTMSFLRPMALPRAASLGRFLTTATSTPAASSASSTAAAVDAAQLTYRVNRTPSQQLPIYLLAKRGGNLKQTRLRKIEGDIAKLKQDLQKALGIVEDKEIQINQLTKHIIIKVSWPCEGMIAAGFWGISTNEGTQGHRKPEVAKFLEERKF